MTVRTEPAIISSVSCTCSPKRLARATGSVYFESSVSTTSGQKKSFHVPRKVKMASVTRMGRQSGRMISAKMRTSLAPSMRAASSSSSGMERAYWRTRKMPKMVAMPGRITPQ